MIFAYIIVTYRHYRHSLSETLAPLLGGRAACGRPWGGGWAVGEAQQIPRRSSTVTATPGDFNYHLGDCPLGAAASAPVATSRGGCARGGVSAAALLIDLSADCHRRRPNVLVSSAALQWHD